jgi:uncharacterized membrane protein
MTFVLNIMNHMLLVVVFYFWEKIKLTIVLKKMVTKNDITNSKNILGIEMK